MSDYIIRIYRKYLLVVLALTIIVLLLFVYGKNKLIINTSPSIPLGIYALKPISGQLKQNDLIAFCLNKKDQDFALSRGYILAGTRCNGSTPLLKSIIAIPGDKVTLTNNEIIVNNKIYNYPTQQYDSKHRLLPSWPRGNYQNTQGFWVIGTNSNKSWDSRYFGSINRSQIIFLLKPLCLWT
jgi:conjugative transfer signal peptidase TraF